MVKRRKVTLETSVKSPSSDGVDETEERKPKLEPKTPEDEEEGVDGEHQDIKPVIDNCKTSVFKISIIILFGFFSDVIFKQFYNYMLVYRVYISTGVSGIYDISFLFQ